MALEKVKCICCHSDNVIKYGKKRNGKQNYYCKDCHKQFLTDYTYNACKPETKSQVIKMTTHASGIRDIAFVLMISPTTVIKIIRNYAKNISDEKSAKPINVTIKAVEADEQWSYAGKKK